MEVTSYDSLSSEEITGLCCWREARGETAPVWQAQLWSVRNRAQRPRWWNQPQGSHPTLWHSTVLKPWQYSSFNHGDPNETKWPMSATDENWGEIYQIATDIVQGPVQFYIDPTNGATHYYDLSISWPKAWGLQSEWENTYNTGRLKFFKEKLTSSNFTQVSEAMNEGGG